MENALLPSSPLQQVLVISGLSGAGKSVVLKTLEDIGYFCIDNLPIPFLIQAVTLLKKEGYAKIAIGIDARGEKNLSHFPRSFECVIQKYPNTQLLFVEASLETLVKRFSETRRTHPLAQHNRTVSESVLLERAMLAYFIEHAHRVDTSNLSTFQLRAWISDFVVLNSNRLTLIFESFGFKYGLPGDADFVFDARCLPNPYYDPAFRPLTGKHPPVADFLGRQPLVLRFQEQLIEFLNAWLPHFSKENRHYLTVAIGCTGGQHRSVYLVEALAKHFSSKWPILTRHRGLVAPSLPQVCESDTIAKK